MSMFNLRPEAAPISGSEWQVEFHQPRAIFREFALAQDFLGM